MEMIVRYETGHYPLTVGARMQFHKAIGNYHTMARLVYPAGLSGIY